MSDIGTGAVREERQDAALLFSPLLVFCRIALVARGVRGSLPTDDFIARLTGPANEDRGRLVVLHVVQRLHCRRVCV